MESLLTFTSLAFASLTVRYFLFAGVAFFTFYVLGKRTFRMRKIQPNLS
jgi:hypothetical protein